MGSLVAINLCVGNILINKNSVPILFYWDGESDVKQALQTDETFIKYLNDNVLNTKTYTNTKISYFYFTSDDNMENEVYNEVSEELQNWYNITQELSFEYLKKYFNYLYQCATKTDYIFEKSTVDDIQTIYDFLLKRYKTKITKLTVINYIYSELKNAEQLSEKNAKQIRLLLENILENK